MAERLVDELGKRLGDWLGIHLATTYDRLVTFRRNIMFCCNITATFTVTRNINLLRITENCAQVG